MSGKSLLTAIAKYFHGEWGFVGTRSGMSALQHANVIRVIREGQPTILRHKGQFGSDMEIHQIWQTESHSMCEVWPTDGKRPALFGNQVRVSVRGIASALVQDIAIVEHSTFLLAAPHTAQEEKSGTWNTIRLAMQRNTPTLIFWPSGKITFYLNKSFMKFPPSIEEKA